MSVARGAVNLTAYAVRRGDGRIVLAVINKDLSRDATVTIAGAPRAEVMRLRAPSVSALKDVSLGGAGVDGDGHWTGARAEPVRGVLNIPAASAALVTFTA